jgi:cytochrome c5
MRPNPASQSRTWIGAVVALVMASGCAALAHPTEADARWAAKRTPGMTLASLERGRRIYVERCSGCHHLPLPESQPADHWEKVVDKMAARAHLSEDHRDLVVAFLASASARLRDDEHATTARSE